MRMHICKNLISFFFLSSLLFLRIADAHAFSHFSDDNDQIDCELCDIITTSNQFTPIFEGSFIAEKPKHCEGFQVIQTNFCYETSQYSITLPKSVYNKPPPSKA